MSGALQTALPFLAWIVAIALFVFGLRRIVFSVAALWRPRPVGTHDSGPSILVLLAAHNEAPVLARALSSIDQLAYPADLLEVTVIDDGSTDATGAILAQWAQGRPRTRVANVSRDFGRTGGKAGALAEGLAWSEHADLVAVVDADYELEPAGLAELVRVFSDPLVGAASGYVRPRNASVGIVARYAALETWLHQLVTSAAKDRLALDPPTLGVWVVRSDILRAMGGFPMVSTGEDVRVAAAIARLGFRTRFLSSAVATNAVAGSLREYWWQHLRWARDVYASELGPKETAGGPNPARGKETLARRAERLLSATGYADRLALVSAAILTAIGALPAAVVLGYLAALLIEILVAIRRGGNRVPWETPRVFMAAAAMFCVDVAATIVATAATTLRWETSWRRPARRAV